MSVTLLAASADDSRLAYIHGGRLVLCDARALTELSATDAPEGARQLVFFGPPSRLLVATDDELVTYELATMTVLGRRTVASGARVAAVVDNRAVLWLPSGPSIALARFLDDAIDVHALDTSGPPVDIAPLEQSQALIVTAQRNEVLDLVSRRVVARLHLPLPPPPRLLGPSGGLRFLWTATAGARELTIIRLSDGRSTTTVLPAPIRQVITASTSSWLCVRTDDGLVRVHVMTQAVHRVEDVDLGRGACVGGGADAGLYWIDPSWRLRRTSLAGDAVVATAGGPLRLAFTAMDDRAAPASAPSPPSPVPQTLAAPAAPGSLTSSALAAPSAIGPPMGRASAAPLASAAPFGLAQLEPSGLVSAAPPELAQLEPSGPVPARPLTDAAPLFAEPPPVRPAAWTAPLIAVEPINATPLAAPPPALAPVSEPPPTTSRPPSRLDERVRRAGLRAARADGDAEPSPPRPISYPTAALAAPPPLLVPGAPAAAPAVDDLSPLGTIDVAPATVDAGDDLVPASARSLPPLASAAPVGFAETDDALADLVPTVSGLTADARPVRSWRLQCATWARHVLAGRDLLEPSFAGTPLGLLARRAHLDPDGARALALLYGAWLFGRPAQPLARVGRTVMWDELAGRGTLPEAGLHTVRAGRAGLRPTVARFLDGARAQHVVIHGLRPRTNLAPGRQLVRCSPDVPLQAAARTVAEHLGAAAIIDERGARGRRQLASALDEAWLRAVPAVVVPGAELDASAVAAVRLRRDHSLVVLWPDSIVPIPLEDWPILEI